LELSGNVNRGVLQQSHGREAQSSQSSRVARIGPEPRHDACDGRQGNLLSRRTKPEIMKQSDIPYLIGFLLITAALAWAASLVGVPLHWIGVLIVFLLGVAGVKLAKRQRSDRSLR
jgi:hypothetical protein